MKDSVLKVIEVIFGIPIANKIRLAIGNTHRNPLTQLVVSFIDSVKVRWAKGGQTTKAFMVIIPVLNLFLLSGILTFLFVLFMDYCLVRYISRA